MAPDRDADDKLAAALAAIRDLGATDPDTLAALAIAAVDLLQDAGDRDAGFAATILRGSRRRPGRATIDDTALLREVRNLRRLGRGRDAVGIVARSAASEPKEVAAIARRLRRKMKRS